MEKISKELAAAYMAAYDEAMNRTFDKDFAGMVAMAVTFALAQRPQQQQSNIIGRIFNVALNPDEKPKKKGGGKNEQGE